jgi:hypothetical protein
MPPVLFDLSLRPKYKFTKCSCSTLPGFGHPRFRVVAKAVKILRTLNTWHGESLASWTAAVSTDMWNLDDLMDHHYVNPKARHF